MDGASGSDGEGRPGEAPSRFASLPGWFSRLSFGGLLTPFDEPISPDFYRQSGRLRVFLVGLLMTANLAGALLADVAAPGSDLPRYVAHQALILSLAVIELGIGWALWRRDLAERWNRGLTLVAGAIDVTIALLALHSLGSVSSHMVTFSVLIVVIYRLVFDRGLAGAVLAMALGGHWSVVIAEAAGWLRPQSSLLEADAIYREPSWQVGMMCVITGEYLIGFVMAHWAVLRLRRREAAVRVLREAFSASDPSRIGELTGAVLGGRYEVRELIGRGGSSEVYAGRHIRTRRVVAMKVLSERLSSRAESLARFRREAEITGQLRSPHVVEIIDVDEEGGYPYLVLELLRGVDLRTHVLREGPLSLERALEVAADVARGLDAAHGAGVVHRDLKPANVFLCAPGERVTAKILDFGIARPESTEGETITRDFRLIGTPAFMAPEQLSASQGAISPATDVFALGATLYFALTGRVAYPGEPTPALLSAICLHRPEPPHVVRPELPPALDDVLLAAMAVRPADRFASASALVEALRAAIEGHAPEAVARVAAAERSARPIWRGQQAPAVELGAETLTA